jgi:hypothetical protein
MLACLSNSKEEIERHLKKKKSDGSAEWRKILGIAFTISSKLEHEVAAAALEHHFQQRGFVDLSSRLGPSLLDSAITDQNWTMARLLLKTESLKDPLKKTLDSRNNGWDDLLGLVTYRTYGYPNEQLKVIDQLITIRQEERRLESNPEEEDEDALFNAIHNHSSSTVKALLKVGLVPHQSHVDEARNVVKMMQSIHDVVEEAVDGPNHHKASKKRKAVGWA